MRYFQYDQVDEEITIDDESILLVKEFEALMAQARNKTTVDKTGKKRLRAYKELKFLYLFYDWGSPYFEYPENERYTEALMDSKMTEKDLEDAKFRVACNKYDEIQNASKIGKLLKASLSTVDKITFYLENLNLEERDPITGKPIFKTKDVIAEIISAGKLIDAIKLLEISFKKGTEEDSGLRGDKTGGMFD